MSDLLSRVPRVDLGVRPTPVERYCVDGLDIHVKRDDRIGGNKVRTLEFLLALPAKRLLTFSTLSAHHAYATAVCGARLGLSTDAVIVRRGPRTATMEALSDVASRVVEVGGPLRAALAAARLWRPGTRIIPPGGMSARGALGYLAAALELDEIPARIYVPMGTGTTASGLLAGLMLRGADTEVVAVRVAEPVGPLVWRRAFSALRLLGKKGERGRVRLRIVKAAGRYGEGDAPVVEGLPLEPAYTGKTMEVLLRERAAGALFIQTYAGLPA